MVLACFSLIFGMVSPAGVTYVPARAVRAGSGVPVGIMVVSGIHSVMMRVLDTAVLTGTAAGTALVTGVGITVVCRGVTGSVGDGAGDAAWFGDPARIPLSAT